MSLKTLSKKIQDSGRGKDSLLVHMSPREVAGLQKLAMSNGGSLTVNPETGLVEAGFLENILPVVAAAAATYFTAGAAAPALAAATGMGATSAGILAGAGSGALISGTTAAVQGKDVGQAALMGGLGGAVAGGMGAYGDASTFAADAAQKTAIDTGVKAGTIGASTGVDAAGNAISMVNPAGQTISSETGQALANSLYPNATQAGTNVAQMAPGAARNAALEQLAQNTGTFAEGAAQLPGQGLANAPASTSSYYGSLAPDSYLQKAGIQSLPVLGLIDDEQQGVPTTPEEQSRLKRISPNFRAQAPIQPNPYYNAQYPGFAGGGLMAAYQSGGPVERMSQMNMAINPQGGLYPQGMIDKTQYAIPTQRPTSMEVLDAGAQRTFARGGIADLGGYSDGGRMLKGPGDGMSDSIPGVIGGKQPARLADGEFVVPADVVSHLGNGSTDAGAKKLYAMMNKIRKARTGKKKQAPAVNAARFLPA